MVHGLKSLSRTKIDISQDGICHVCIAEIGTAEVGTAEVDTGEDGIVEVGTAEVGTAEVGTALQLHLFGESLPEGAFGEELFSL